MDCDRESANAIEEAIPIVQLARCYFHFGQSIWMRAQRLGLAGAFSAEDEFKLSGQSRHP